MKKPLDHSLLDFLDPSVDLSTLTVSSDAKVLCICAECRVTRPVTFFSVYRQRATRGQYVCRSCTAKVNGTLASRGLAKRVATNRLRYGTDHPMQNAAFVATQTERLTAQLRDHHELVGHPMHNTESCARLVHTNMDRYGVPYTTLLPQVQNTLTQRHTSGAEQEVRAFLETHTGVSWDARWDVIAPKQLDCYSDTHRTAVEYNGLVWHSERMGKTRWSHHDKYRACQDRGVRLLTIFEDEWMTRRPQVESILLARLGQFTHRIAGRATTVCELPSSVAVAHVNTWHLQPHRAAWVSVGLHYHDTLIGVMTFNRHHRTNTGTMAVLSRLCFAPGYQVIGGASKLLQASLPLLRAQGVTSLVSWSDNRWSEGDVYRTMGWHLDAELPPDYSYVLANGRTRVAKQSCRRRELGARPGQTEHDRARELNMTRIWDCGKRRWTREI